MLGHTTLNEGPGTKWVGLGIATAGQRSTGLANVFCFDVFTEMDVWDGVVGYFGVLSVETSSHISGLEFQ